LRRTLLSRTEEKSLNTCTHLVPPVYLKEQKAFCLSSQCCFRSAVVFTHIVDCKNAYTKEHCNRVTTHKSVNRTNHDQNGRLDSWCFRCPDPSSGNMRNIVDQSRPVRCDGYKVQVPMTNDFANAMIQLLSIIRVGPHRPPEVVDRRGVEAVLRCLVLSCPSSH
jgi:hypothetical protein